MSVPLHHSRHADGLTLPSQSLGCRCLLAHAPLFQDDEDPGEIPTTFTQPTDPASPQTEPQ